MDTNLVAILVAALAAKQSAIAPLVAPFNPWTIIAPAIASLLLGIAGWVTANTINKKVDVIHEVINSGATILADKNQAEKLKLEEKITKLDETVRELVARAATAEEHSKGVVTAAATAMPSSTPVPVELVAISPEVKVPLPLKK